MKKWLHNVLGWGFPNNKYDKNDSCGCKFCDYTIEQDSTGSWFHLSSKFEE